MVELALMKSWFLLLKLVISEQPTEMIDKKKDIGFNRKVRADWLKEALQLTASGVTKDEIEPILKDKIVK